MGSKAYIGISTGEDSQQYYKKVLGINPDGTPGNIISLVRELKFLTEKNKLKLNQNYTYDDVCSFLNDFSILSKQKDSLFIDYVDNVQWLTCSAIYNPYTGKLKIYDDDNSFVQQETNIGSLKGLKSSKKDYNASISIKNFEENTKDNFLNYNIVISNLKYPLSLPQDFENIISRISKYIEEIDSSIITDSSQKEFIEKVAKSLTKEFKGSAKFNVNKNTQTNKDKTPFNVYYNPINGKIAYNDKRDNYDYEVILINPINQNLGMKP